jgi:Protein of unknown function (DUF3363)
LGYSSFRPTFSAETPARSSLSAFNVTGEALRRAAQVERIDEEPWKIAKDLKRGQAYDLGEGGDGLRAWTLSAVNLEQQTDSESTTWPDRDMNARDRSEIRDSGFGREVEKL